uniref:carboxypeptidase M isoform X2 n=1 Tax=Monopterus albus TaxID=43700 RepID=UPI0009B2EBDF|nr:carboxypeptidase M isoform X2 [Monopterus albus]
MSSLLLFLLPFIIIIPTLTLDFHYHSNREIEQYLLQLNASNPSITYLYSIGQSVRGQQLWVLALGLSPHRHTIGIPEFKYVANMHGNEVLGRVLLLQLIDDLVRGYRNNETWSLQLLKSTRIHILPTMNPDGFDEADTDCQYTQGRYNYNGIDLNRNFPDAFAGPQRPQQFTEENREAEVRAVIGWLRTESFVLSANLHGGALVASYPYDNSNGGSELVAGASVAPDNDVFVHLAKMYSNNHATMSQGGMQDYNYVWAQCLELTLEVSCCKFPPEGDLPALWKENRKALLAFIQQVHLGVKGRVFDGFAVPVHNAVVEVKGRMNMSPFRTNQHGEYYRLLLPGTYSFTVTYPGHEVLTETLNVPYGPDKYSAMTHDFLLRRLRTTGRTPVNPILSISDYALDLERGGAITRSRWTGLVVGLSLTAALWSLID